MTTFIRLLDVPVDDKAAALKAAVTGGCAVFECDPEAFAAVPGSPFAYWVHDSLLRIFRDYKYHEAIQREAKNGLGTLADFRFVRLATEIPLSKASSVRWVPFSKGGRRSEYYQDVRFFVLWATDGAEVKAHIEHVYRGGHWSRNARSVDWYFRPGITWPLRGVRFSAQAVPEGGIFSVGGKMLFSDKEHLLALLSLLNSQAFDLLLSLFAGKVGGVQYESGLIERTPLPVLRDVDCDVLAALSRRAWSLARAPDSSNECSRAFLLPPSLNEKITGRDNAASDRELAAIQAQIDDLAFRLYGISAEDRANIEALTKHQSAHELEGTYSTNDDVDEGGDPALNEGGSGALASWLIGVAFARFDPRLSTGERPIPPEPEPFDALPERSPGMYPEGEEPVDRPAILVDDEGHTDDLAARAQAVAERVQVDVPENLRAWLARDFFPLHIRMYSKSRRKAPIYWQLATPSASYSVWLYIHAFSKDTLFRVQNDYVALKLAHEERRLEALTLEQRDGANATERKALAEQQTLVEELRAFLVEVKRVAPLWNPDLDDGVIINFSLLWRLVPQHKHWQKELKQTWDALCEGKYDWAHLAMHLWPERIIPKCAKDRSLAIAHDLENVFWEEDDDGKWQPVKVQQAEIDQLIAERTSAAVKDALQSLLDAPPPATGRGGGRRASGRGSARRTRSTTGRQRSGASAAPDHAVMDAIKQAIQTASDGASKADVLAATSLSDTQWNAAINALLANGLVVKSGAGRGTRYHLNLKP